MPNYHMKYNPRSRQPRNSTCHTGIRFNILQLDGAKPALQYPVDGLEGGYCPSDLAVAVERGTTLFLAFWTRSYCWYYSYWC